LAATEKEAIEIATEEFKIDPVRVKRLVARREG
jgi:hypothetical protein